MTDMSVDLKQFVFKNDEFVEVSKLKKFEGRFIKGPIPLSWIVEACKLGGQVPKLAYVIWYLAGMNKSPWFRLNPGAWKQFSIERHSLYRALNLLEEKGLIEVLRKRGKSAEIRVIKEDTKKGPQS